MAGAQGKPARPGFGAYRPMKHFFSVAGTKDRVLIPAAAVLVNQCAPALPDANTGRAVRGGLHKDAEVEDGGWR